MAQWRKAIIGSDIGLDVGAAPTGDAPTTSE